MSLGAPLGTPGLSGIQIILTNLCQIGINSVLSWQHVHVCI